MPSIEDFANYFKTNPIQRTNRFSVGIQKNSGDNSGLTEFFAESVTLPGRSVATLERRTFGPQRDLPYEHLYSGDIELNVVMTESGGERAYFEEWMNEVIDAGSFGRVGSNVGKINSERQDYVGEMYIRLKDPKNATQSILVAFEVFPKSLGQVVLSNTDENSYGVLPVSLSFRFYEWMSGGGPPDFKSLI